MLGVPGLGAGVVAGGAATVSAAAVGAALAFSGVRARQLEAFRKGREGELLVNTPAGRKVRICVWCEYHDSQACKGEPPYVFAWSLKTHKQSCLYCKPGHTANCPFCRMKAIKSKKDAAARAEKRPRISKASSG